MACKFSCFLNYTDAFKENEVGVFHAENHDTYRVTYKSNVCRDLFLKIEWGIPKQILLTVKLYNTTYKRCFSSKGMVVNGKKTFMRIRGVFNVSNSRNYKVLCVIDLIPYIHFNDSNEMPLELTEDSGFVDSENHVTSVHENNNIYQNATSLEKNAERNSILEQDITAEVNGLDVFNERKVSREEKEKESPNSPSLERNFKLYEPDLSNNMVTEDSVVTESENISLDKSKNKASAPLVNGDCLNSHDQCNNTIKNVCESLEFTGICKSGENFNNNENALENSVRNTIESTSIDNSYEQTDDYVSSNDLSNDLNTTVKSKPRDSVLITKLLTLDDYCEEIVEDINTMNISRNVESENQFPGNNSPMEIDLTETPSENDSETCSEESIFCNSDSKVNKEDTSANITTETNRSIKAAYRTSKDKTCSDDAVKPAVNSDDMGGNFSAEFNDDVYMENNQSGEKDFARMSKGSIDEYSHTDPSKINNTDIKVINKNKNQIINIEKPSDAIQDGEIHNTASDHEKIELTQLCRSKTALVFKTLVRKLSEIDCDGEVTDVNEAESSSNTNVSLTESEIDNSKIFPIMECELKGLSLDMLDLLTSGDMADAVITNGEKSLKVHRLIVSARSSTLKQLFHKHEQDELKHRAVVDISSSILEEIIVFLYVGLVPIKSIKMAHDLYNVAERYGINDLIDICGKYISKSC